MQRLMPTSREPQVLDLRPGHACDQLERTVVLNEVREVDRQQRIREGVLKQINPESRNETGLSIW
jgi:hypothetical protein